MKNKKTFFIVLLSAILILVVLSCFFMWYRPYHSVYSDTSISANKSEIEVANETAELPVTFACATELKPADRLRYSEMFYFKEEVPVLVEINCSYGNVSKLELYYVVKKDSKGYDKKFLGNIEIVNENKHGQLEVVLPVGDGELIIENGGSHNIMVDSVTINHQ